MKDEFKEMFFEAIKDTSMIANRLRSCYYTSENSKKFTDKYYINKDANLIVKHTVNLYSILNNFSDQIYEIKMQYSDGTSVVIDQSINGREKPYFNISEGYILLIHRQDNQFSNIYDIKKRKIIFPEDKYYSTCFDLHFESLLGKERYAWMRKKNFDKRNCGNCEYGHYVNNLETNEERIECENSKIDHNFIPCECPDPNKVCLYHEFIESDEFEIFKQEHEEHFDQITLEESVYMSEIAENQSNLAKGLQNKVLKKKFKL